jgi:type VII secretion-associated serine protease mycosin
VKLRKCGAALAALTISVVVALPASPAQADWVRNKLWYLDYLKISQVHAINKGSGVTVAVVDTGVDPHPDLRKNLLNGTDVLPGETDNGQIDSDGHGTAMAGLIAAHGRSAADGLLGIAPAAKILPVKDQKPGNNGGSTAIGNGIEWAAQKGAKVINVSSATGPSFELNSAIKTAAARDAVVVAGSGNKPDFLQFGFPAAMPGVLAVGATDRKGRHAAFSVTGPPMQICAPGVDIETARLNGRYSIAFGTSEATAIVSGAAALVRAKFPQLSAQDVIHRLTATATDIGAPGRDDECGYGVLNIVKALTADVPPLQPVGSAGAASPTPTSSTPQAAAPDTKPTGNTLPAVVGSVVAVLLIGGLVVFLTIRRRKTS